MCNVVVIQVYVALPGLSVSSRLNLPSSISIILSYQLNGQVETES